MRLQLNSQTFAYIVIWNHQAIKCRNCNINLLYPFPFEGIFYTKTYINVVIFWCTFKWWKGCSSDITNSHLTSSATLHLPSTLECGIKMYSNNHIFLSEEIYRLVGIRFEPWTSWGVRVYRYMHIYPFRHHILHLWCRDLNDPCNKSHTHTSILRYLPQFFSCRKHHTQLDTSDTYRKNFSNC